MMFHARNGIQKTPRRTRREIKTLGRALWVDPQNHQGVPLKPTELAGEGFLKRLLRTKGAILTLPTETA